MPTLYIASDALDNYIKYREGCAEWNEEKGCYVSYPDGGGLGTIGYGHLITHAEIETGRFKDGLTSIGCNVLFTSDMQKVERQFNSLNLPNLSQGQVDAMLDFAWNCGFRSLCAALHDGLDNFPKHCVRYVHNAKGIIEPGLVSRRKDEISWFLDSEKPSIP